MRKSITVLIIAAIVAALVLPAAALAKGPNGKGGGVGAEHKAAKVVEKQERSAAKEERSAAKEERKAEKAAAKAERKALRGSDDESGSVEASETPESDDASGTPQVTNAFSRITANIEKSLAKVAAGTKKQVPPGLVRVWLKFAAWLGVDPSTMPGTDDGASDEDTSTIEPTSTVEPTGTVEPTATVVPTE